MGQERLADLEEKSFLKKIVSKYARTAALQDFDDCIIIDCNLLFGKKDLPYIVYSIDHPSFIRRPFDEATQYKFYGCWVAAIVCGDVLAMGAQPKGFSLDIAAPLETEVEKLEHILQGVHEVLENYGADYEGGNFDVNALELVGMAWGIVDRDKIIRRSGARTGDFVAVTTTLGHGWADYVSRKLEKDHLLSEATRRSFHEFKIRPIAPCKAILAAVETAGITSGMDLSDGLIEFLYTIQERNKLGVRLFEDWFPITTEMEEVADKILNIRPGLLALEAGYDTPLGHAYTIAPEKWEAVSNAFEKNSAKIYKLGVVEKFSGIWLQTKQGKSLAIPPFWDDQFAKQTTVETWLKMITNF